MTTVRTRIAPSPTGDPHVGTAYIALFNLCFARQHQGQFILRIEDTDQVRSTPESEAQILSALNWMGLQWDEGPDVGGPHAPYRQSERSEIYKAHAQELVQKGHAFHCFCSSERLDVLRTEQMAAKQNPGYDGHCLSLGKAEVEKRLAAGESAVIRMKVPREGVCVIPDMLRGNIEIPWSEVDMQVLMKADGLPTYHLANVVDDHLMEITHVIRGEEWISSTPKHVLLYTLFGWQQPVFCHMPLLRNPDKSKLSKRKNPTSITYYERMGFLPEALLNYLGRMGWSMPDEREKFSLAEMVANFDITRVSLGGPIFDIEKLSWLNSVWLREMPVPELMQAFQRWAFNPAYLEKVVPQIQTRIQTLSDAVSWAGFFFAGQLKLTPEDFAHKKLSPDEVRRMLQITLWELEALRQWEHSAISALLSRVSTVMGIKLRDFMPSFFVAIAGSVSSTPVMEAMAILGPDMTRARLRHALAVLGGVSKNELKEWDKAWREQSAAALAAAAVVDASGGAA
ncbi:glutamate--tRNA ligase [Pseudomonas sp.]|uniref:glutamate--tRNA ligase n=1 Tax=Pseudomonas sp. TaxID=306 RepID=UPI0027312141|nr:glutamate--tRNA ligase [Pseudomonas sp.]MDP2245762.1 glutamate--tRNA ligase [Pseudomonas sp.]